MILFFICFFFTSNERVCVYFIISMSFWSSLKFFFSSIFRFSTRIFLFFEIVTSFQSFFFSLSSVETFTFTPFNMTLYLLFLFLFFSRFDIYLFFHWSLFDQLFFFLLQQLISVYMRVSLDSYFPRSEMRRKQFWIEFSYLFLKINNLQCVNMMQSGDCVSVVW